MKVLLIAILIIGSARGQITTIPQNGGGGGGSITADRVAFGDGTSTPATDNNFVWDNTNKRLQVGSEFWGNSYKPLVQFSAMKTNTETYSSYTDPYNALFSYTYGDGSTGQTKADIKGITQYVTLTGNADLTYGTGGIVGIYQNIYADSGTGSNFIRAMELETDNASSVAATEVTGIRLKTNATGTSAVVHQGLYVITQGKASDAVYGIHIGTTANGGGGSVWAFYSEAEAPSYFNAPVNVGYGNTTDASYTLSAYSSVNDTHLRVKAYSSQSGPMQSWVSNGDVTLFSVAADGIPQWTSISEPTCDSSTRGKVTMVPGGMGVADTFRICAKDNMDAYAWTALY